MKSQSFDSHYPLATNAQAAHLTSLCASSSIVLAACLTIVVPYDSGRNTDMQGLLLLLLGGFAWCALGLRHRQAARSLGKAPCILLAIFLACCLLSTLLSPHLAYNLLGAPHLRLGGPGLIACVGFGLLLRDTGQVRLISYLYYGIVGVTLISIPYTLLQFHSVTRIGGVFAQADVFAVFLTCGLLLGGYLLQRQAFSRTWLLVAQLLLFTILILTATRAAAGLILLLYPLSQQFIGKPWKLQRWLLYVSAATLLVIGGRSVLPPRYTNISYANESLSYRLDLQKEALQASADKPFFGYGMGNVADALDCHTLRAAALQKTCHEGYFFNSSHNIFLDRILGLGWFGGIAYIGFVVATLYRGLRGSPETRVLAFCGVLIALYYLTNVTSVTLELFFWILLFQCLRPSVVSRASASR